VTSEPRLPTVGESIRLCGKLVEIQDVTPPVTTVLDYVFEVTSATIFIKTNGVVIDERETYNDFCGPPEVSAIAAAKKLAAQLGGGVEIVVVRKTELVRKRPTHRESFYAKGLVEFETISYGCRRNLPDDREEQVWSSKAGDA
jgi:hypothetical protein